MLFSLTLAAVGMLTEDLAATRAEYHEVRDAAQADQKCMMRMVLQSADVLEGLITNNDDKRYDLAVS